MQQRGSDTDSAAKVTIDGKDQNIEGTATCATTGGNINIAFGRAAAMSGLGAVLGEGDPLTVQSVALGNINGVTLGFAPGTAGRQRRGHQGWQHLQDQRHRDRD